MKSQRKSNAKSESKKLDKLHTHRNGAIHIPLDFEQAVEGLLNVKPKKRPKK